MQCPFPGMDPYIEMSGLWDDFHADMIAEIKRAIAPQLPPHYAVRTGERYYVDVCSPGDMGAVDDTLVQSDASVVRVAERLAVRGRSGGARAPVETEVAIELEFREKFLDIREMRSGHIVTTIEVLSPGNKRGGEGRHQYLLKRNACLLGERNFVEIDLLRGGTRMPPANEYPAGEYFVALFRMTRPGKCGLWPIGLRDRLPTLPVPLLPGEVDLRLDLAPMVNAIYVGSNYGLSINYALPLSPKPKRSGRRGMVGGVASFGGTRRVVASERRTAGVSPPVFRVPAHLRVGFAISPPVKSAGGRKSARKDKAPMG